MRNKKSRLELCQHDFEGFMHRPDEGNLVETVRKSMDHLGREISDQEARDYISIHDAWTNTAHHQGVRTKERKPSKRRLFSLDEIAADDGVDKSILMWGSWWKQVKDGRIQASSGDIYSGVKELREAYQSGDDQKAMRAMEILASIKSDLKDTGIITGTLLDYIARNKDLLTITHHYDCQYKKEIQRLKIKVPSCDHPAEIEKFASHKYGGVASLQAIFRTKDNVTEMIRNLGFVSGMTSDNIIIFLPNKEKTRKSPHRVMHFAINGNYLLVSAALLNVKGRSRGVYPV